MTDDLFKDRKAFQNCIVFSISQAFKKFRQTLGTQNVQHRVPCEKWTHLKELIDRGCGLHIRKEPVKKSHSAEILKWGPIGLT